MATKVFDFLYYLNEVDEKHMRVKSIRARNIKWACRKFMKSKPDSLVKVDYEVRHDVDSFTDISDEPGISEYM